MNKYFVRLSVGMCGMDATALIEEDSSAKAEETAYEMAIENAETYGFYQDYEHFGDNDQVGYEWDDELQDYDQSGEIDCTVEPYNPEEHDDELIQ